MEYSVSANRDKAFLPDAPTLGKSGLWKNWHDLSGVGHIAASGKDLISQDTFGLVIREIKSARARLDASYRLRRVSADLQFGYIPQLGKKPFG